MANGKGDQKRNISEDLERLLRDAWNKVVEYASIGAEEASRMSATAKIRVDMETLRFKRGKLLKTLGERYYTACSQNPDLGIAGTKDTIRQINGLDQEIANLERSMSDIRHTREREKGEKEKKGREDAAAGTQKPAEQAPRRSKGVRASKGKRAPREKSTSKDDS